MTARTPRLAALFLGAALAQSGLLPPSIGLLRDTSGGLRQVFGTRANFVLGEELAQSVESAAFWNGSGLVKTATSVEVVDEAGRVIDSSPAPPGPALFGFTPAGAPAVVCFPGTRELRSWQAGVWRPVELDADGEIVAVSGTPGGSILVVARRGEEFWKLILSTRRGRMQRQELLPAVSWPLLLLPDGQLLYVRDQSLEVRGALGNLTRLELPGPVSSMALLADGWIHLSAAGGGTDLLLCLKDSKPALFQLPGGRSR
jgi:hypothetical protein